MWKFRMILGQTSVFAIKGTLNYVHRKKEGHVTDV